MSAEDLRGLAAYDQARAERPAPPRCEACDTLAWAYHSDACRRRAEEGRDRDPAKPRWSL